MTQGAASRSQRSAARKVRVRHLPNGAFDQTLAFGASPVRARHVRLRPGLVNEDEPGRIDGRLTRLPTPAGDVRPILFGCAKALWNGPPLLPAMYARRHFQEEEWE
jgi:hypothetical protein